MTRQLKCVKCKKLIDEDEKAFRCNDCETYPFHEDCLDDDGNCAECVNVQEKEDETEKKWKLDIETSNDTEYLGGYTKKQAEAYVKRIELALKTGSPKFLVFDDDDYEHHPKKFVVSHIVSFQLRKCW